MGKIELHMRDDVMDELARLFWPYVKKAWADPELRKEAIIAKMHWRRIDAMQKATGKGKARRAIRFKIKKQIQEAETGELSNFLPINACFQKSRENEE